jgi:putative ABC transport system permease protein
MALWMIVVTAVRMLRSNKLRTFLTLLGMVVGVAAVVLVVAIGAGTRKSITDSVRGFGANLLSIRPEFRRTATGVRDSFAAIRVEHAEAILRGVPEVDMVSPDLDESLQVKYMNHNDRIQVNGEAPTYFTMRNFPLARGRVFTDQEVNGAERVAVIGPAVASAFFDGADPLGETIKIRGLNFLVIGVTKPKDENSDNNIWVPYTTMMRTLTGRDTLDQVYARVRAGEDMQKAIESIRTVMRRVNRLQADQPDNFRISNRQEVIDSLDMVTRVLTYLLGGVAAISLVVGGINIMNIMLMTVTERTREIGVRRALGARRRDILIQFLIESVILGAAGGAMGLAAGYGAVFAFNEIVSRFSMEGFQAIPSLGSGFVAFAFSLVVGAFFGYYPARRAADLDPVEALRYE